MTLQRWADRVVYGLEKKPIMHATPQRSQKKATTAITQSRQARKERHIIIGLWPMQTVSFSGIQWIQKRKQSVLEQFFASLRLRAR